MLSPAERAAMIYYVGDPGVALAKPRSTPGFMLTRAARASIYLHSRSLIVDQAPGGEGISKIELLKVQNRIAKRGYEANFIVLDCNPLVDFQQIKNIRLHFKQGYLLEAPK